MSIVGSARASDSRAERVVESFEAYVERMNIQRGLERQAMEQAISRFVNHQSGYPVQVVQAMPVSCQVALVNSPVIIAQVHVSDDSDGETVVRAKRVQ